MAKKKFAPPEPMKIALRSMTLSASSLHFIPTHELKRLKYEIDKVIEERYDHGEKQ